MSEVGDRYAHPNVSSLCSDHSSGSLLRLFFSIKLPRIRIEERKRQSREYILYRTCYSSLSRLEARKKTEVKRIG